MPFVGEHEKLEKVEFNLEMNPNEYIKSYKIFNVSGHNKFLKKQKNDK